MSFLLDAVQAAQGGIYEFKDFLRTRCRVAESDATVAVGGDEVEVSVLFTEGRAGSTDEGVWELIADLSTGSAEINCDRGEVMIAVEFD